MLSAMAESVGVTLDDADARPVMYLSSAERLEADRYADTVVVQSSSSRYWTPNKNWVQGRMQAVADGLRREDRQLVQLGSAEDEPLDGVSDLRGKTDLRQTATILAGAALFVGLEGGLVHLARAVDTPAVVVYTGYTRPEETGYPTNVNIRAALSGESCWRRDLCDHCRASADAVTVEAVLSAAVEKLRSMTPHGASMSGASA